VCNILSSLMSCIVESFVIFLSSCFVRPQRNPLKKKETKKEEKITKNLILGQKL
jgi:hypothetical protein